MTNYFKTITLATSILTITLILQTTSSYAAGVCSTSKTDPLYSSDCVDFREHPFQAIVGIDPSLGANLYSFHMKHNGQSLASGESGKRCEGNVCRMDQNYFRGSTAEVKLCHQNLRDKCPNIQEDKGECQGGKKYKIDCGPIPDGRNGINIGIGPNCACSVS